MVLPVLRITLRSIGYGAMELPACRFGKPLGFTEKQVSYGTPVAHKTIPDHKHKKSKQQQLVHDVYIRTKTEHQTSDRPRRQDMEAPWRTWTSTSVAEAHDSRLGDGTRHPRTSTIGSFCRSSRNVHRHPGDTSSGLNASAYTQHRRGVC